MEPSDEPAQGAGFLHLVPVHIPEGLTVNAISAIMLPWRAPAFLGANGFTTDGTPAIAIAGETPLQWARWEGTRQQFEMEHLYAARFRTDFRLATGLSLWVGIGRGSDPPDLVASTGDSTVGVESSVVTVPGRRLHQALFLRLRRRLQAESPTRFHNLAGQLVHLWFTTPEGSEPSLPPRDDSLLDALVDGLADYIPQPNAMVHEGGLLPEQAPEIPLGSTPWGARFYSIPLTAAAPASMLFLLAGFEIDLWSSTLITRDGIKTELERLIEKHDKPGVDLLLLSCAAPDQTGWCFPSEHALYEFISSQPALDIEMPKYIQEVVVHTWFTGEAIRLIPGFAPLIGPIYSGFQPATSVITAIPQAVEEPAD